METKKCARCAIEKPISEFDQGKRKRGLLSRCRDCVRHHNDWMRATYRRDPQAWMAKQRARHAANPLNNIFQCAKRRAKNEGLPFTITKTDIVVPGHCPLLGIPLKVGRGAPLPNSPTLDRIIPQLGYVPGNVWVISYKANTIKSDATLDELLTLTRNLSARIRLKVVA